MESHLTKTQNYGGAFTHNPITVSAVGKVPRVGIKFGRMKNRNGVPKDKLIELFTRLNNIPGVHLPADGIDKYPNILLSTLAEDDALDQFLQAIAWTNQQVKAAPARRLQTQGGQPAFWASFSAGLLRAL
jgi:hypothetical protein